MDIMTHITVNVISIFVSALLGSYLTYFFGIRQAVVRRKKFDKIDAAQKLFTYKPGDIEFNEAFNRSRFVFSDNEYVVEEINQFLKAVSKGEQKDEQLADLLAAIADAMGYNYEDREALLVRFGFRQNTPKSGC